MKNFQGFRLTDRQNYSTLFIKSYVQLRCFGLHAYFLRLRVFWYRLTLLSHRKLWTTSWQIGNFVATRKLATLTCL